MKSTKNSKGPPEHRSGGPFSVSKSLSEFAPRTARRTSFGGKGVSLFRQDQSPGPGWMTFPMFQVLATRRAASSRSSAVR